MGESAPHVEPLPAKARTIIRAAGDVFRKYGYGAASVDAIARKAGVSKATIYAYFSGKDALFAAVVDQERQEHTLDVEALEHEGLTVEQSLERLARSFLDIMLSSRALAIYRVVVAETGRFPELGELFYRSGPAVHTKRVAQLLGKFREAGALDIDDLDTAAMNFISIVRGDLHLRCLFTPDKRPDEAERQKRARNAVKIFMRAYSAPDASSAG